jgi:alpha-tubulin suppressor-like RCC1 family protein
MNHYLPALSSMALTLALASGGCGSAPAPSEPTPPAPAASPPATLQAAAVPAVAVSAHAKEILFSLRARSGLRAPKNAPLLAAGPAQTFGKAPGGGLRPRYGVSRVPPALEIRLPEQATGSIRIQDAASGAAAAVKLVGARDVEALAADGFLVYPRAHLTGATVLHRPLPDGLEDFLSFDSKPARSSVSYELTLEQGLAGLRLVAGALEMLDKGGAPRLRVSPPYLVGADGARTDATLAVSGCRADTNPAPPWGRRVTPPGAGTCTLHVTWPANAVSYPAVLDPRWTTTASMATPRQNHTATLMTNGKVLVAGGSSNGGTTSLATAEVFDPATSTWTSVATPMISPRQLHAAIQLGTVANATTSGKVLITGGLQPPNGTLHGSTLYSPTAGTWTAAQSMPSGFNRHLQTITMLGDGRVLVTGGMANAAVIASALVYDPEANSWATAGTMSSARRYHTATPLVAPGNAALHNKVLVVGGNAGGATSLASVQLFDPATSTWSEPAGMQLGTPREGHTATALANGNVLVTGGKNGATMHTEALVFDVAAGGWQSAGTVSPRIGHTATRMPAGVAADGQVLVAGGSSAGNTSTDLASIDVWISGAIWTPTAPLGATVRGHTATLFDGKRVLIAGGARGTTTLAEASIYDPSHGSACTSGSQCASGTCVDGVCCDTPCGGGAAAGACTACNLPGFVGTCRIRDSGSTCSDGNFCTVDDRCNAAGVCQPGAPKTCAQTGPCRGAGTCAPATGTCSSPSVPDGLACDDGNRCTAEDTCQAGTCLPGVPNACAAGTPQYAVVTDLGVAEGDASTAVAINDGGEVVGYESSTWGGAPQQIGFRHKPTGAMSAIRPEHLGQWPGLSMEMAGINGAGVAVGAIWGSGTGFAQSATGAVTIYPSPSHLRDINDAGHVAGFFYAPEPGYAGGIAVRSRVPGTPFERLAAGAPFEFTGSAARAIDATGDTVVGVYGIPFSQVPAGYEGVWGMSLRPFVSRTNEVAHDLNDELVPMRPGWTLVGAWDITGPYVVGHALVDGELRGYRYHLGNGTLDEIGTLPDHPYKTRSWAKGVNAAGYAVGVVFANNGGEGADLIAPWVYTPDGRHYDLNDFVDPASDWLLQEANAINHQNEVVGWGFHGTSKRAFKLKLPDLSPCPPSDQCHGPGVRDPVTGSCSWPAVADGTACDDNQFCTVEDTCHAGACQAGAQRDCAVSNSCLSGICNQATGACEQIIRPDGTTCSDGNACTQADACHGGTCIASALVTCAAPDPCRPAGICDPATGACSGASDPDPSCAYHQIACDGPEGGCSGEEPIDIAAPSSRASLMDIIDLGPDDFVVGYSEGGGGAVRYRHYRIGSEQRDPVIRVAEMSPSGKVSTVRANSSNAIFKPDADCTDPASRWATYTNYFAVAAGSAVFLDTFKLCDGQVSFSRSPVAAGSGPSVASTPAGRALIAYEKNLAPLTARYVDAPPAPTVGMPATLGVEFGLQNVGGTARATDMIYNQHSDAFIVGVMSQTPITGGKIENVRVPNGSTSSMAIDFAGNYDHNTGGHTTRVAYNPLGDGTYPWWYTEDRAFTIHDQNGLRTSDPHFATHAPHDPSFNFYNWVPIARTYDSSRLPLLYVFFKTSDLAPATHLYGLRTDKAWVMVDPLADYGVAGDPVAVRSLRAATVGLNYYWPVLKLIISDHVSPWPAPPLEVTDVVMGHGYGLGTGLEQTCAIRSPSMLGRQGTALCWGSNSDGKLADGTQDDRWAPAVVPSLGDVTSLAAGGGHTCAAHGGVISCWGRNHDGQLGNGAAGSPQLAPVTAVNLPSRPWRVAAGSYHTCASSRNSDHVFCWGSNSHGQLGSDVPSQDRPVVVPKPPGSLYSLATGHLHTCWSIGGSISCWGSNDFGQLGRVTGGGIGGVGSVGGPPSFSPMPVPDAGFNNWVVAGLNHTCTLDWVNGEVKCWGQNSAGQLGDGFWGVLGRPSPQLVEGLGFAISVAAGAEHTCASIEDGTVSCWGDNTFGQLGDGTTTRRARPVTVPSLSGVVMVSAGGYSTCAVVFNGDTYCWGHNGAGQLGDGTTLHRSSPVLVSMP